MRKHTLNGKYRLQAIDFSKGVLVIFMVAYHALNYLHFGTIPHEYMGFLPHSFIMIAGFIITKIYFKKSIFNYKEVSVRLAIRALKVLLLFIFLNLSARMFLSSNHYGDNLSMESFFSNWFNIFVIGNAEAVAFEVLVPISYTLYLSIPILKLQAINSYFVSVLAFTIFVTCILTNEVGLSINNLNFISSGVIGMALGLIPIGSIDKCAKSWGVICTLAIIYGFFLIYGKYVYFTQILITVTCSFIIYSLGIILHSEKLHYNQISLLGKYSLISYVIQIFYLQVINKLPFVNERLLEAILLIVIIAILTWITVVIVDYVRCKYGVANKVYNVIFH